MRIWYPGFAIAWSQNMELLHFVVRQVVEQNEVVPSVAFESDRTPNQYVCECRVAGGGNHQTNENPTGGMTRVV